jgi:TRAP-type uncharacterized transport system fused permease subunit
MIDRLRAQLSLGNLILAFGVIQLGWLLWYYYTGRGGPQELVAHVLSIAIILQILFMYQQDYLYRFLPPAANHLIVAIYIGICAYAFIHFYLEFEEIAIWRQGTYTRRCSGSMRSWWSTPFTAI